MARARARTEVPSSWACFLSGRSTRPAWRQIWAAMSLWGRPAAENRGIFWPRAMLFITSTVDTPVWIISSGYVRSEGLMEEPIMSR